MADAPAPTPIAVGDHVLILGQVSKLQVIHGQTVLQLTVMQPTGDHAATTHTVKITGDLVMKVPERSALCATGSDQTTPAPAATSESATGAAASPAGETS